MSIVINEGTLSDIFFNMRHDNWDDRFSDPKAEISPEDYASIIRPDAEEFCKMIDNQVSVDWLVNDFIKRV